MRPLTERDLETLAELVYARYESTMKHYYEGGSAPLDFGGSNGSHHGKTATKLVKHGFVEHRKRGHEWGDVRTTGARGSKVYRATEAGRDAIEAWETLMKGQVMANLGSTIKYGRSVPKTGYRDLTDAERTELRRKCHLEMPE